MSGQGWSGPRKAPRRSIAFLASLRSRLILLTLVLLVPALATAGMTVYAGYRHDRQEVEKHLQETARALSLVVDRQFGQAEALLWALSTSPQLKEKDYAGFMPVHGRRSASQAPGSTSPMTGGRLSTRGSRLAARCRLSMTRIIGRG